MFQCRRTKETSCVIDLSISIYVVVASVGEGTVSPEPD